MGDRRSLRREEMEFIKFQFLVLLLVFLSVVVDARPEIWPPTGKLSPNNYIPPPRCRYEQETVLEDTIEEICTTKDKKECSSELVTKQTEKVEVKCNDVVEKVCKNETVTEFIEKCNTVTEKVCDSCSPEYEEKCEDSYEVEMKSECSYETVVDMKCSRAYEVSYMDECLQDTESKCKLFGNFLCEKVTKIKCRKVPKFPSRNCQNVPRLSEVCKQVPVTRPAKKCVQVLRKDCGNSEESCEEVTQEACEKVPKEVVKQKCEDVTKEKCEDVTKVVPVEEFVQKCKTVPEKECKQGTVKRPRVVPKRICEELKDPDLPTYEKESNTV